MLRPFAVSLVTAVLLAGPGRLTQEAAAARAAARPAAIFALRPAPARSPAPLPLSLSLPRPSLSPAESAPLPAAAPVAAAGPVDALTIIGDENASNADKTAALDALFEASRPPRSQQEETAHSVQLPGHGQWTAGARVPRLTSALTVASSHRQRGHADTLLLAGVAAAPLAMSAGAALALSTLGSILSLLGLISLLTALVDKGTKPVTRREQAVKYLLAVVLGAIGTALIWPVASAAPGLAAIGGVVGLAALVIYIRSGD